MVRGCKMCFAGDVYCEDSTSWSYAHERKCSMHRASDAQRSALPPLHNERSMLKSVEWN
jgi:hypothetical protein